MTMLEKTDLRRQVRWWVLRGEVLTPSFCRRPHPCRWTIFSLILSASCLSDKKTTESPVTFLGENKMTSSIFKGVTILIVGVVQYKEEAELFKFRKLIVLSACAVLATGVLLFIIKVLMVAVVIITMNDNYPISSWQRMLPETSQKCETPLKSQMLSL